MDMQEKLKTELRANPRALGPVAKHTTLMEGVRLYAYHKLGDSFDAKTSQALGNFPRLIAEEARLHALGGDVMVFRLGFNMNRRNGPQAETLGYAITEENHAGIKGRVLWKQFDASATKEVRNTFETMLAKVSLYIPSTIPNLMPVEVW